MIFFIYINKILFNFKLNRKPDFYLHETVANFYDTISIQKRIAIMV